MSLYDINAAPCVCVHTCFLHYSITVYGSSDCERRERGQPKSLPKKFGFSVLVHFSRNGSSLSLCLSLALSASFESHCMCCAYADRWRKEEEKEFDTKGTKKKYRKQATYTPWLFNAGKELSIIPPENSSSSLFGLVERSRERT